jgi:hypothetical protein
VDVALSPKSFLNVRVSGVMPDDQRCDRAAAVATEVFTTLR